MKRRLYVSLILALLIATPLAAQRARNTIRPVQPRDMLTTLRVVPANAWEAFVDMLFDAQRRLWNGEADTTNPTKDNNPTMHGVITEPLGGEQDPPPPPPDPNP